MVDFIKDSPGALTKFLSELPIAAPSRQSLAKFLQKGEYYAAAQVPVILLNSALWKLLHFTVLFLTSLANSVAILICYVYLKNYRRHSLIIVDGYVVLFKTFAEFIGAAVCVCYGLLEVDLFYTILGIACIFVGVSLKALLIYQQTKPTDHLLRLSAHFASGLYILCIFLCGLAFHQIVVQVGVLPCASRLLTCVVPLVALADSFGAEGGSVGGLFSYVADAAVVMVLWWFCSHLSLKCFVVAPSVIGLLFAFIQYLLREVQKVTSAEIVTDIYAK